MSKVSDEQYIKDLEHDIDMLSTMVLDLRKENEKLKGTHRGDKWRVEQYNRNRAPEDQIKTIDEIDCYDGYIYESPDNGETVYRREFNDYENKTKVQIDKEGNPISEQLELFPFKA